MYQKIMVPLDGSELAECVLPHVEALAKLGDVQEVLFVRVVEVPYRPAPLADISPSEEDIKRMEARSKTAAMDYLDGLTSRLKYGKVNVKTEVLAGRAAETLVDYAKKNKVDLIVMVTHGRSGISRWVWGSVASRILHSSCVPVFLVRAHD